MHKHRNYQYLLNSMIFIISSLCFFPADAIGNEYLLAAGDRVKVVVFGHPDLSGDYEVDSEGRLSLPLIKSFPAAGLTLEEIENAIADKLSPDYLKNPRVGVVVLEYRPFYILGEVKSPGSYPYSSNMTVIASVALAGGYTYRAKKNKVTIIRANDPEHQKTPVDDNTPVMPGDVIEVPERFF
jgi:protein involved in polysaccharide export with SLBB domain